MISTMPLGACGSQATASRSVIWEAVRGFPALRTPMVVPDLNIDGGVGLSRERRRELPVLLLPLFNECGAAAQRIVDAVHGLQQASLEFRVVVVTDMSAFKQLRPYGWAIAHIREEASWDLAGSWLGYAQTELDGIVSAFGCSYVIETSERGISERSWAALLAISGMGPDLPNVSGMVKADHIPVRHYSWRGWMSSVPAGSSTHQVFLADEKWTLDISRSPKSSMVLLSLESGKFQPGDELPDDIREGWNVVRMRPSGGGPQVSRGCMLGVAAIFDGLSLANTGIFHANEEAGLAYDAVSASAVWAGDVSVSDVRTAYRRALSTWSTGF